MLRVHHDDDESDESGRVTLLPVLQEIQIHYSEVYLVSVFTRDDDAPTRMGPFGDRMVHGT